MIEPVSADSLRKTGIFADLAGDFCRFRHRDLQTTAPETESIARKARVSGPFQHPPAKFGETLGCLAGNAADRTILYANSLLTGKFAISGLQETIPEQKNAVQQRLVG